MPKNVYVSEGRRKERLLVARMRLNGQQRRLFLGVETGSDRNKRRAVVRLFQSRASEVERQRKSDPKKTKDLCKLNVNLKDEIQKMNKCLGKIETKTGSA